MKKTEILLRINNLNKAFETLKKGVSEAQTDLEKDGVIQKPLKRFLEGLKKFML